MKFRPVLLSGFLCMLLSGCGGGSDNAPSQTANNGNSGGGSTTVTLKAYVVDSPYAQVLADCVESGCELDKLPLIGLEQFEPDIDQIMAHVVVSHDWMGLRFKEQLQVMPNQLKRLFRSVSAIVIASDIRPSHYRSDTGAIYLDPAMLWLTNEEKASISTAPDYRSNFGKDLQFVRLWRYVIDNDYAWRGYSLTGNEERTAADTQVALSWLLYHELAHANDCATLENMALFDLSDTFYNNHLSMVAQNRCVYQRLAADMGLQSQTWFDLAQVFFHGEDSTAEQRAMTPIEAGHAFMADQAMDAYSYASVREDVAMAFEAVMMKRQFNADRDMAIIKQYADDFSCDAAQIKWGQRARLADADVMARSQYVTSAILPDEDLDGFYALIGNSIEIPFDHNWCEPNLAQSFALRGAQGKKKAGEIAMQYLQHLPAFR